MLKYDYPFEEIEAKLNACKNLKGTHTIMLGQFDIEHLMGESVYSAKKIANDKVLDELDAVCPVLENAEHHSSRLRGI